MPREKTRNAGRYCEMLLKLSYVIQNRWPLSRGILLLPDNARRRVATKMQLNTFRWVLLDPSFHPLLMESHWRLTMCFKENVTNCLNGQAVELFDDGMQKLMPLKKLIVTVQKNEMISSTSKIQLLFQRSFTIKTTYTV